ncbi:MAG: tRNA lysidine(34) synthetase TilS [Bacteroidota bacterium]
MTQPKKSTLVRTVQQFMTVNALVPSGGHVIIAVSGGIDSMVLLDIFAKLQEPLRLTLTAAHVNFQLRGKESDADEVFVKRAADQYQIPLYIKRIDTGRSAKKRKRSIQETARDIRYSFFDTLREKLNADCIVTAHHSGDNTETVLINLLRGSGIDGLAGIPMKRDSIIRPLLCADRAEVLNYAKANGIKFRNDSSNMKDDYTRNYLRNSVIPMLEQRINPSLNDTIRNTSTVLRSIADHLNIETDRAFKKVISNNEIILIPFGRYHQVIQQSVIHRLLNNLDIEPTFSKISAVHQLAEQQKGSTVQLHREWTAERLADKIILQRRTAERPFKKFIIPREGTYSSGNVVVTVTKSDIPDNKKRSNPSEEYVDASTISFPLIVRTWRTGDSFCPIGMKGTRKLSDFFVDLKLSQKEKKEIPVLECSGEIVWVAGKRLDDRFKLTDSTSSTYHLTVKYNGQKDDHR